MPHPATPAPGDGESSLISPVLPSANAYPEDPTSSSSSSSSSSSLLRPNHSSSSAREGTMSASIFSSAAGSSSASPSSSSQVLPPPREHRLSVDELKRRADDASNAARAAGAEVDLRVEEQIRSSSKASLTPPKGWLHFVAGGVGGMCGGILTAPLDVAKTRLQSDLFKQKVKESTAAVGQQKGAFAQTKKLAMHFVETGQLLKDIATKEGPSALFKGLGPTLVGAVPARSINFATYGNGKVLLAEHFNNGNETPVIHLTAAAIAGIVTATATNPIWVVKTRMQLESHEHDRNDKDARQRAVRRDVKSTTQPQAAQFSTYSRNLVPSASGVHSSTAAVTASTSTTPGAKFFQPARSPRRPGTNSLQMISKIVKNEGIKGLYKGMSASYLGVAEGTIQWVLYEYLKRGEAKKQAISGGGGNESGEQKRSILSSTIGPAGTAKFTAALITYPHEVIRTRLRQQPATRDGLPKYTGLLQTIKLVFKEEGFAALYGGLSAHLLRVVPNAAVMFTIYELALRMGTKWQVEAQEQNKPAAATRTDEVRRES